MSAIWSGLSLSRFFPGGMIRVLPCPDRPPISVTPCSCRKPSIAKVTGGALTISSYVCPRVSPVIGRSPKCFSQSRQYLLERIPVNRFRLGDFQCIEKPSLVVIPPYDFDMASSEFLLISHWLVAAPREAVWRALRQPLEWPTWWFASMHSTGVRVEGSVAAVATAG